MAEELADHTTLATANTAAGLSVGTGVMTYLNENAAAIGAMVTVATFIVALIFYILNYRLKKKAHDLYREEIIEEIVDQLGSYLPADNTKTLDAIRGLKERRKRRR